MFFAQPARRSALHRFLAVAALLAIAWIPTQAQTEAAIVDIAILQLNDVYEMTPLGADGGYGGLARVASLRQRLLQETPHVLTILAGDVLSPSALSLAVVDGAPLAGKQMVAAFNALGADYMTFGNHEFDLKREAFLARLAESRFKWVSANVFDQNGKPFPDVPSHVIREFKTGDRVARVGLFGVTLNKKQADYVSYNADYVAVAKEQVAALKAKGADIIVAITHLAIDDDMRLAAAVPEIDLSLGGHEHENVLVRRGSDFTPVAKADANARTVYIHRLSYSPDTKQVTVSSRLRVVDASLPDEPKTAAVVNRWIDSAFNSFRQQGLDPKKAVATTPVDLDGMEASVRNKSTELTRIIAQGMVDAVEGAELAVFNGGSIRIDDVIPAGQTITVYDVMRILPFGGVVVLGRVKGDKLASVLTSGVKNEGTGGFLHYANVEAKDGAWLINGAPLDPSKTYKIAINDYLFSDDAEGFDLGPAEADNPNVIKIGPDVRQALSEELAKEFGGQ